MDLDCAARTTSSPAPSTATSSSTVTTGSAEESNAATQAELVEAGVVGAAGSSTNTTTLSSQHVTTLAAFGIGPENLDDDAQARMSHALGRLDGMLACAGGDEAACTALGPAPIGLSNTTSADGCEQEIRLDEADYTLTLRVSTDPSTGKTTSRLLYVDADGTCISGLSDQPLESIVASEPKSEPEATSTPEPLAAPAEDDSLLSTLAEVNAEYHVLDRFGGALQVIGGASDLTVVIPLLLAPEPTMATKALAAGAGLRGVDDLQAGLRTLWTGEPVATVTQDVATDAALALGADPDTASMIGLSVDLVTGLLSPVGRLRNATTEASERLALAAQKNVHREQDGNRLLQEGRAGEKTTGTAEKQLTEAGLNKPVPLTPDELARVFQWQNLRNGYLKKWRELDLSAWPEKTQHLLWGSADNAIRDGMTPNDLAAVIKERRGVEILKDGGEVYDHLQEAEQAMDSVRRTIEKIKERIGYLYAAAPDAGEEIGVLEQKLSDLSTLLDAYEAMQ